MREHWGIENRLHHVRDVTFGEDACRARTGEESQNLAAIRNAAVTVLLDSPTRNRAVALRRHAAHYQGSPPPRPSNPRRRTERP